MNIITQEQSLLLQCLSTSALLGELSNADFLNSDYFTNLKFENKGFKNILSKSGIGNPATMQMLLYMLLVVPKELLSRETYAGLEKNTKQINKIIGELAEEASYSSYESDLQDIDYFRHIRNAVAHSKCKYYNENEQNYVIFRDSYGDSLCEIKIECRKIGNILMELQRIILKYLDIGFSQ